MTRLLIIGDSHAAALRQAASRFAADWPTLQPDFAAMHGEMRNFTVKSGHLTARKAADRKRLATISGRDSFPLADYDALAICGGAPSAFQAIRLWQRARFPALPSALAVKPGRLPDWHLISEPCFLEALTGLMRRSGAFGLLAELARASAAPRFLIPMPLPSAAALPVSPRHTAFAELVAAGDAPRMAAMLDHAFHLACEGQATPVPWPAETRQSGLLTHPNFRRGATRLSATDDAPQPDDDFLHANADYGRAVLTSLAARL